MLYVNNLLIRSRVLHGRVVKISTAVNYRDLENKFSLF